MTLVLDIIVTISALLLALLILTRSPLLLWIAAAIVWRWHRRAGWNVRYREMIAIIKRDYKRQQRHNHKTQTTKPFRFWSKSKKPAIINQCGDCFWFKGLKLHRKNGPAIEWANGNKEWRINGELHREDGPAVERKNGFKTWYRNGKPHRIDGPAVELPNGHKQWWIDGMFIKDDYA